MTDSEAKKVVARARTGLSWWIAFVFLMICCVYTVTWRDEVSVPLRVVELGLPATVLLTCVMVWHHLGDLRWTKTGIGVVAVYSALGATGMFGALLATQMSGLLAIGAIFWLAIAVSAVIAIRGMLRVRELRVRRDRDNLSVFD